MTLEDYGLRKLNEDEIQDRDLVMFLVRHEMALGLWIPALKKRRKS